MLDCVSYVEAVVIFSESRLFCGSYWNTGV